VLHPLAIPPALVEPACRAIIGVLTVDGEGPSALQRAVLSAIARQVLGRPIDVDQLEPMSIDEAAELADLADLPETTRERGVGLAVTLQLIAYPPRPEVVDNVERFASRLRVRSEALHLARDEAQHHLRRLYADVVRQSWYTAEDVHQIFQGHLLELARSKLAYYGIDGDERIARRWESLGDNPPGSLGAGVAAFYEVHGFPYPGEPGGIYEVGAHHDFVHVLADYPTSPEGEIDVFAFIAGTMQDPKGFVLLAMTLCLFQNASLDHLHFQKIPIARADSLDDPGAVDRFAEALRRASLCPTDVMAGIDHFALAGEPLADLRQRFGIVPKQVDGPGAMDVPLA